MIFSKDKEFKLENKVKELGFLINLKTERMLDDEEIEDIKQKLNKDKEEKANKEENKGKEKKEKN